MILPLVFTPIRLPGIAGKAVLTLGRHVPGTEIDGYLQPWDPSTL